MKNHLLALVLSGAFSLVFATPAEASGNNPPAGFTALFNGTDLSGWWGAETEDPRKYLALPADEFKAKRDAMLKAFGIPVACGVFGADMQLHLVNDGPVTIPLQMP